MTVPETSCSGTGSALGMGLHRWAVLNEEHLRIL